MLDYIDESIHKDMRQEASTAVEQDLIHLAMDPLLAKRMEKKFMVKIDLIFNKESGLVELAP